MLVSEEAVNILWEAYAIQEDTTRIYGCGCNFVGKWYDQDDILDYLWTYEKQLFKVLSNYAFLDTYVWLCKLDTYAEGDMLLEGGWCAKHAEAVITKVPRGIYAIIEDTPDFGCFVNIYWTEHLALQAWFKNLKTLKEVGFESRRTQFSN